MANLPCFRKPGLRDASQHVANPTESARAGRFFLGIINRKQKNKHHGERFASH
jgi:hypothetical protein